MNQFQTIAFKDGLVSLNVRVSVEDGTVWLSVNEMAQLFKIGVSTVRRYIGLTHVKKGDLSKEKKPEMNFSCTILTNSKPLTLYNDEIILGLGKKYNYQKIGLLETFIQNQKNVVRENNNSLLNNDCIIYNNGQIDINVKISPKEETVWLSQSQIADLFGTTRPNITMHIQGIYDEGELTKDSVSKDFLHTALDDKQYLMTIYNLDMILAVGYRIKGKRAIEFRKWASSVLKQYLFNGYAINENRAQSYSDIILNLQSETIRLKNEFEKLRARIDEGLTKEQLFVNGQFFDAHEFFCSLMRQAQVSIKIIDPYFDDKGLAILSKSKRIDRTIYLSHPESLNKKDIMNFKSQYGDVKIKTIKHYHDRFIIIDNTDCYLIGTSLNNAGAKTFAAIRLENKGLINKILESLN